VLETDSFPIVGTETGPVFATQNLLNYQLAGNIATLACKE